MSTFATLQKCLPQHGLSRLVGKFGTSSSPWIKQVFINQFARAYDVNMAEAAEPDLSAYACFNDFFTRALRPGAREVDQSAETLVSPADGAVSQLGAISGDELLQAKGQTYTLSSLAGILGREFLNGSFCTIYLAPSDYHRVHLPFTGYLSDTLAVPGALFSVNGTTEGSIAGLFCRNERLVCRFETELGPMLVILVGAMIVASIETVWSGPTSPYTEEVLTRFDGPKATGPGRLDKGDEIGRFLLGSTVICCFPQDAIELNPDWHVGHRVRMGEVMASRR